MKKTKLTRDAIVEIISMYHGGKYTKDEITDEMSLEDLGLDSLDHVELTMHFEEELSTEIPDDDADKYFTYTSTVAQILAYLDSRSA